MIAIQEKGLISVIVPVYNVEQYLADCIQSILMQTYSLFEIILVDDGSTDGSGILCDVWQKKDSRIRVFHQKNSGLSAARNRGMREAKGEYLCFVDSDDWIAPDYLKILYENLLTFHADVSCCRYLPFFDGEDRNHKVTEMSAENCPRFCMREELWDVLTDIGADCQSTWLIVAWNKLICREAVKEIVFPEGRWHEDEFFIHRLLMKINNLVDTDVPLYYYRKRADSITGDQNEGDVRHLAMVDAWNERVKMYRRFSRKTNQAQIHLYHKMVSAYRMTIRIQYGHFNRGILAVWLKLRYLWSYVQYPEIKWHLKKMLEKIRQV